MNNFNVKDSESVDASPVKSFFVSMLTRDILLEDAILDLLDNCVDGILRSNNKNGARPYKGFEAKINFDANSFSISDNCGGIPRKLRDYAFRMGRAPDRPDDAHGSVGVYGIGMKRAIFKIGDKCLISTRNADDQYEVSIEPHWIKDEDNWNLPVRSTENSLPHDGTIVKIEQLHAGISEKFGSMVESFSTELKRKIATHYAYIIEKGLKVTVNDELVECLTTKLVFDDDKSNSIKPYVFKSEIDGVQIFLTVGFTRPIPSDNEMTDEKEVTRYSTIDAGWTIVCNNRVVLYCDRSELTGWGEANVPRYHTQFIAIAGILEFQSDDPSKLPTTTTKRGIDASSSLFLQVKNHMRMGMRLFTNYTNKWKGREDDSKKQIEKGKRLSLFNLKESVERLNLRATKRPIGKQFKPKLPLPQKNEPSSRRISFVKEEQKISTVADYLRDIDMPPSEVGEKCFDLIHSEASG